MYIDRLMYFKPDRDSLIYRFSKFIINEAKNELLDGRSIGTTVNNQYEADVFDSICNLISFGTMHGFEGNLWHMYLTDYLINHENEYTRLSERVGYIDGSVRNIALKDIEIFIQLFAFDIEVITRKYSYSVNDILDFKNTSNKKSVYDNELVDKICTLSKRLCKKDNPNAFLEELDAFYKKYGVGMLGLHKAFRINDEGGLYPVSKISDVTLDELVGYEEQKKMLIDNTSCFVNSLPANNCLLYGQAGTGKSTSIKAITNKYYEQGLRTIEIYKHQFKYLNDIMSYLKNRNYRFILYMDDLSFEDFETEYKYLKAVIEGGLEEKPENILIYATSNRRHLIKESFKDKEDRDDLHKNDTVEEKLSLYDRFGVTIYYGAPNKKEFNEIVKVLKERNSLNISDEDIIKEANIWEMHHGGLSGRTAKQFIDYMKGISRT